MEKRIYMERIDKIEAQPGYQKFSNLITLRKRIEKLTDGKEKAL